MSTLASVDEFVSELHSVGPEWYTLGIFLNTDQRELSWIEQNYKGHGIDRCLIELYNNICVQSAPHQALSWGNIVDCLSRMGNNDLADKIRQKYCSSAVIASKPAVIFVDNSVSQEFEHLKELFANLIPAIRHALRHALKQSGIYQSRQVLDDFQLAMQNLCSYKPIPRREMTFTEVFNRLRGHYSFLNITILRFVLHSFVDPKKNRKLIDDFQDYCQKLQQFKLSTKMNDLAKVMMKQRRLLVGRNNPRGYSYDTVFLKLEDMWDSATLAEFETFVKMVFQTHFQELIDIKVIEGCISVSWLVNSSYSCKLHDSVSKSLLNNLGCIYLKIDDNVIFQRPCSDDPIRSFNTALSTALKSHDVFALEVILTVGFRFDRVLLLNLKPNLCSDTNGFSVLHSACSSGNFYLVEALLDVHWNPNAVTTNGMTAFMCACKHGHSDIVRLILTKTKIGIEINFYSLAGFTALHFAAEKNFVTTLSLLLEFDANPNSRTNYMWTPLLLASYNNHLEAGLILLRAKADPNACLPDGTTCLVMACRNNNTILTYYLLEHGANPNNELPDTTTPLLAACENGNQDIINMLIDKHVNVNALYNNESALHISCRKGHSEIATLLLNKGADPFLRLENGDTPLTLACETGMENVVLNLLDKGCDPNNSRSDGWTPLMLAALHGHNKIVNTLLLCKNHSDPSKGDKDGLTPLMIACKYQERNINLIKSLLKAKAPVNAYTDNLTTALHFASCRGNSQVVSLLLGSHADVNFQNSLGITPLMFAAKKRRLENVLELIKDASTNLDIPSKDKRTALYFAVEACDPLIVENLLRKRANPNISNINGWTPLMVASAHGYADTVKALLKHSLGINLELQNKNGMTALELAVTNDNTAVVEILLGQDQCDGRIVSDSPMYELTRQDLLHQSLVSITKSLQPTSDLIEPSRVSLSSARSSVSINSSSCSEFSHYAVSVY